MSELNIKYNPYKVGFWAFVVIAAVFLFIFLKGCFSPAATGQDRQAPAASTVTIVHDTVNRPIVSAAPIQTQPIIISSQPPAPAGTNTIREIIYKQDTAAIAAILTKYFSSNNYSNVLKIDTIGTVTVNDTISQNAITGRSYTYNLHYPVITNTVTIDHPYQPKNQLYIGAGAIGDQASILRSLKAGVLIKNKKDAVLELNATRSLRYWGGEIGFYKLISFRKK